MLTPFFHKKIFSGIIVLLFLNMMPAWTNDCLAGIHLKKKINAAADNPAPLNAPLQMEPVFISAVLAPVSKQEKPGPPPSPTPDKEETKQPAPEPEAAAQESSPVTAAIEPPLLPARPPAPGYKTLARTPQVAAGEEAGQRTEEQAEIKPEISAEIPEETLARTPADIAAVTPQEPEKAPLPAPAETLLPQKQVPPMAAPEPPPAAPVKRQQQQVPLEPLRKTLQSPKKIPAAPAVSRPVAPSSQMAKKTGRLSLLLWLLPPIILGALVFFIAGRKKKKKKIFVMFRDQQQLVCSRWHNKNDRLCCEKIQTFDWRQDTKNLFLEAFNRAGYQPSMFMVPLLASEQVRTFLFSLPRLKKAKLKKAVEERMQAEKISFNPREEELHIAILEKSRKEKKMRVLVTVCKQRDFALEWPELGIKPDMICSVTAGLAAGLPPGQGREKTAVIAYRLNEEELIILNQEEDSLTSRRLYALNGAAPTDDPAAQWRKYFDQLEQIIELYYRRHQQLVSTIYLGGKEVPLTVDPHGEITRRLKCEITRLESGHRAISCQEILLGAARLMAHGS